MSLIDLNCLRRFFESIHVVSVVLLWFLCDVAFAWMSSQIASSTTIINHEGGDDYEQQQPRHH
jgi:hypothetical protein